MYQQNIRHELQQDGHTPSKTNFNCCSLYKFKNGTSIPLYFLPSLFHHFPSDGTQAKTLLNESSLGNGDIF